MWKGLVTVCTILAGAAGQKALSTGWRATTGRTPPSKPESPHVGLGEAVAFAAVAGAVINVVRVVAIRQVAQQWTRRNGGVLPKALQDVA